MTVESDVVSRLVAMTFHYDSQDADAFLDCWTDDAILTLQFIDGTTKTVEGKAALRESSKRGLTGQPSPIRHIVTTPSVRIDGKSAYLDHHQLYIRIGDPVELEGAGTYQDLWRLGDDGKWRIAQRKHVFLSPLPKR
jgi:ketosteroid isomerase-like protein